MAPTLKHYEGEDGVYIRLRAGKVVSGKDLDDRRHIDLDQNGNPVGVDLMDVSHGVDLNDLPEPALLREILAKHGIKERAPLETYGLGVGHEEVMAALQRASNRLLTRKPFEGKEQIAVNTGTVLVLDSGEVKSFSVEPQGGTNTWTSISPSFVITPKLKQNSTR